MVSREAELGHGGVDMAEDRMQLTDEVEIPTLGFGTYLIPNESATTVVEDALRVG